MDGVCTNFIESCILANNLNPDIIIPKWKKEYRGIFDAYKVFNIDNSQFWKSIDKQGEEFWSEMGTYPWFKDLYDSLSDLGEVYFLTSPSQNPSSLSGKLKWLQKHFNKSFKDYVITPKKHLLANENSFLIDDYPQNVDSFNKAGGTGILFPQFWNSKTVIDNKVKYIIDKISD